jgi:hypothetical protein
VLKDSTGKIDAVMALPFARYDSVDWRFITGFERRKTPASDFLAGKFTVEARDISLNADQSSDLFDQTELAIAFGHARRRAESGPDTWMPMGRFICQNNGLKLESELKRIEELPDSDAFFKSGVMGETKVAATILISKIRQFHRRIADHFSF